MLLKVFGDQRDERNVSDNFKGSLGDQSNEGTTKVSDHLEGSLGIDEGNNKVYEHIMHGIVVGSLGDQEVSDLLIAVENGTKEVSDNFEGSLGDQSNERIKEVSDQLMASSCLSCFSWCALLMQMKQELEIFGT